MIKINLQYPLVMGRTKIFLVFVIFFFGLVNIIYPQENRHVDSLEESIWKGFKRYDFELKECAVRMIIPDKKLPGNPWIWRARFPDWHTMADSLLISEGFHLIYANTDNEYGAPNALRAWDIVYEYVTNKFLLHKKVALMGVSRGGLFVYNWAKANPEKVSCIYAEAPVCDFKSWPMGQTGIRSDQDWDQLKKAYGFASNHEAVIYRNNPIDNLAPLAKAKVPVLHMIGLDDQVVPPAENTFKLVDRYLKLGGVATVVPCTRGKQKLHGHHFEIETPRLVADFIKYHTLPYLPLDASDFHDLKGGIQNSHFQFEQNKSGRVAFLGGSISFNGGWRDSLMNFFIERFPHTRFEFINAGIPSMGSTPSAFRLERDLLSKGKVDLIFMEAAVNDETNGRTSQEQLRAVEGIIRNLRRHNPAMDIVMMHFVDPDKMNAYRNGKGPAVITNHNKVASHYGIPTINLAMEVTERIDHGEFSWEEDFKDLHPSPFGQGVYARSMIQFLNTAYGTSDRIDQIIVAHALPKQLDPLCYDHGKLIKVSAIKPSKEWHLNPSWNPDKGERTRPNYTDVPMMIGQTPGKILKIKFKGNAVGIAVAAGPDAGIIEYRIDKGTWKTQNLFTQWSSNLHLPWYYTLATGLANERHTLEIRVSEQKDEKSQGHACRIRYVYMNLL